MYKSLGTNNVIYVRTSVSNSSNSYFVSIIAYFHPSGNEGHEDSKNKQFMLQFDILISKSRCRRFVILCIINIYSVVMQY